MTFDEVKPHLGKKRCYHWVLERGHNQREQHNVFVFTESQVCYLRFRDAAGIYTGGESLLLRELTAVHTPGKCPRRETTAMRG